MDEWVMEEVRKVLPESDAKGRHFWQSFVERIDSRFAGLQGPDGGESFVRECVAMGCSAVPVARRNSLWEQRAPDISEKQARGVYELRIRLALFFAGTLRHLIQGAARLRVNGAGGDWHPAADGGASFGAFAAAQEGKVDVTWTTSAPDFGEAYFLAGVFLPPEEQLMLTPDIAREVLNYVRPDDPAGLFGMMLYDDGQLEKVSVDVAGVFLEALAECVNRGTVRVNTRVNGQVFVTPDFWLLTAPIGVDCVLDVLRTRREGRRYDFSRQGIFRALHGDGHLMGKEGGTAGNAAWVCRVDYPGWDRPLELKGLLVRSGSLPVQAHGAPGFEGTVTLQKERFGGNSEGQP